MNLHTAGRNVPKKLPLLLRLRWRLVILLGVLIPPILMYSSLKPASWSGPDRAKFDQLQVGMTREQVEASMGPSANEVTFPATGPSPEQVELRFFAEQENGSPSIFSNVARVSLIHGKMHWKLYSEPTPRERWGYITDRIKASIGR